MLLVIKNLVIIVELFGEKCLINLSFLEFSSPFLQSGNWVHCLDGYSPFTVPSKGLQT